MVEVILNPDLEEVVSRKRLLDKPRLIQRVQSTLPKGASYTPTATSFDEVVYQEGFLNMVSEAYSLHQCITIAPHDLWQIVLSDLAEIIKADVEGFRPIFTKEPGKIKILVPTDDPTTIDTGLVVEQLLGLVPVNINVYIPPFSTHGGSSYAAACATFADAVQHYYSYGTFMCGIKAIRFSGTKEDWMMFGDSLIAISAQFEMVGQSQKIAQWFERLIELLVPIVNLVRWNENEIADNAYWKSIFRQNNIGSGGQLEINGWLTDFYHKPPKDRKLENFRRSYGAIPYQNLETQREFTAVHGAFYKEKDASGFFSSKYGQIIFEKKKNVQ